MRKAKSCYSCPVHTDSGCSLGYKRNISSCNVKGTKGLGHTAIYSPEVCCHKPKTQKEFFRRLKRLKKPVNFIIHYSTLGKDIDINNTYFH